MISEEVAMNRLLPLAFLVLAACAYARKGTPGEVPRSKEAVFVESVSPAEVKVLATGIGVGKKLTKSALLDARRCAVYFVLFGGTDPLLQTREEKDKFQLVKGKYFSPERLSRYITWEQETFESRVKMEGGKKLKVRKYFIVNKGLLREDLVADGVLTARKEITQALGLPVIMVIPEVPKGESPIDAMARDPKLKQAAQVIESYLTARRYDVVVPEQMETIGNLAEAQAALKGFEEDYAYQLALSVGSDVYITFTVQMNERYVGSTLVRKGMVGVRAYETTTARLLGTETGYSRERPSPEAVVVEEAVHDAVDKVLSRIMVYWKEDLERGVQYKVIVKVEGDFDEDELDDLIMAFSELLDELAEDYKENVVTEETMDYLVWADPEKFAKSTKFYRALRKGFAEKFPDGKLRRININRKLLLLKVTRR